MIDEQHPQEFAQDRLLIIAELSGEAIEGPTPEELAEQERKRWAEKLQVFGTGVEAEAEEFERHRRPVEDRMLDDMRLFYGVEGTVETLGKKTGPTDQSNINVNITRRKTNAAIARLGDMLFPSDDKNFGVTSSPRAELADATPPEGFPVPQPAQPQVGPDGQPIPAPPQAQESPQKIADRIAKAKAKLMEQEIEDIFTECKYAAHGREAIRHGCLLGTGILKGPVLQGRGRRVWQEITDQAGGSAWVGGEQEDNRPGFESVSPWHFFPTMGATKIEDSEVNFVRHLMTRRDLIKLSKRDDFLRDQVRKVIDGGPNKTPPNYLQQLRAMGDVSAVGDEKFYIVWERHGPVSSEALQACEVIPRDAEVDVLDERHGVVWVCQGIVIKACLNPSDTGDHPFSVWNYEKDDACIFGYGVPYLMRQPAAVARRTWQMIMDNGGLSVGGQIIVNRSIIEPAPTPDGKVSWAATPLKTWLLKDRTARAQDAFHVFEFPNHLQHLVPIFNIARELADQESGIPVIAEGEQGGHTTKTAAGMEMLMNSHNIVMRQAVKNWDDDITVPNVTRTIDWLMQFSPRRDIKGDFAAVARGTSALLLKETQARNMLNLVNFLFSPALGPWAKVEEIGKKLVTAMQHDPDELLKSKEEFEAEARKAAEANKGEGDPAMQVQQMRAQLALQIQQMRQADADAERQFKALVKDKEINLKVLELAQAKDMKITEIAADLRKIQEKSRADRTLLADETLVKLETGSGL